MAIALFVVCFGSPAVDAVTFLPDDAELACRAILPDCFRRSDWADLCGREPSVAVARPAACRDAGFEPGQTSSGAVMQNGLFQVRPTHRRHHKDFLG